MIPEIKVGRPQIGRYTRILVRTAAAALLFFVLVPQSPRSLSASAMAGTETAGWLTLEEIDAMDAAQTPIAVDWRMLSGLNYNTGDMTEQLKQLNGKLVKIPGYMVPLDDDAAGVTEFLLVPYFGACIHTPPPPPNQIVYVKLNRKAEVEWWNPIWSIGRLEVEATESYYGPVSFRLIGQRIELYSEE